MRTAGQGQAAVPRERVRRRRASGFAWAAGSGPGENISRTVTKVERYPDIPRPCWGRPVLPWGALLRTAVFVLRKRGFV